jgi:hypothetical protein
LFNNSANQLYFISLIILVKSLVYKYMFLLNYFFIRRNYRFPWAWTAHYIMPVLFWSKQVSTFWDRILTVEDFIYIIWTMLKTAGFLNSSRSDTIGRHTLCKIEIKCRIFAYDLANIISTKLQIIWISHFTCFNQSEIGITNDNFGFCRITTTWEICVKGAYTSFVLGYKSIELVVHIFFYFVWWPIRQLPVIAMLFLSIWTKGGSFVEDPQYTPFL